MKSGERNPLCKEVKNVEGRAFHAEGTWPRRKARRLESWGGGNRLEWWEMAPQRWQGQSCRACGFYLRDIGDHWRVLSRGVV